MECAAFAGKRGVSTSSEVGLRRVGLVGQSARSIAAPADGDGGRVVAWWATRPRRCGENFPLAVPPYFPSDQGPGIVRNEPGVGV